MTGIADPDHLDLEVDHRIRLIAAGTLNPHGGDLCCRAWARADSGHQSSVSRGITPWRCPIRRVGVVTRIGVYLGGGGIEELYRWVAALLGHGPEDEGALE